MFCTKCGFELGDGEAYCPSCGALACDVRKASEKAVQVPSRPPNAASKLPSDKHICTLRKWQPVAALVAIAILLLGAGAAWAVVTGPLSQAPSKVTTIGGADEPDSAWIEQLFSASVGDTVAFGSYEQDGDTSNGAEPLGWVVVRHEGSRMQLVSRDLLDFRPYASENMGFAWINSDMRTWLNGEFADAAFESSERALVRDTIMAYPGQPEDIYNPFVDEPEWDQAFLLSSGEANELFASNADRISQPSAYASGVSGAPSENYWWLRTTGFERQGASQVTPDGEVDGYGVSVVEGKAYVRPSLWIALPKDMAENPDDEGRFGAYSDAVRYMSEDSLYALAELDGKDGAELAILSSAWENPNELGVYLYGYEYGQPLYLGKMMLDDCVSATLVARPGELLVYGYGPQCVLKRVTVDGSQYVEETIAQGSLEQVEGAVAHDGDVTTLTLWNCRDMTGLELLLSGWTLDAGGTAGVQFASGGPVASSGDSSEGEGGSDGAAPVGASGTMLDQYSSQATEGYTSTVVDMDDVSTRHDLNLFLSNFTEKSSTFTFDWNTCTDEEMCLFAIDHTRLNFPDAVEDASFAGFENASGQLCTERVAWETFAKYPRVFLKKDFDVENVTDPCLYHEGYVCFPGDGWHVPNGVAYVTSTTDIGDGRVYVTFDVYGDGVDYVVTDESYYTCSADELMAKLGVSGISRSGTAIVEPCDDGTVAPFKLWAFDSF